MSVTGQMRTAAEFMLHTTDVGSVTVQYNGVALPCRIIYDRRKDRDRKDKTMARVCRMRVLKSDLAAPAYQDRVVLAGRTWIMCEIEQETAHDFRLRLETSRRRSVIRR